ncbi:MAG: S-layer homology domain-containing protein [Candidatus Sericytochromatia bacterium]
MKPNKIATILTLSLTVLGYTSSSFKAYALVPANEMRDLSSNHWAYKAIEALAEKYGVMTGYPDKTFKGSKNITRYEMAAALYKVMTKVEELIAKSTKIGVETPVTTNVSAVNKEDIETLKLLQKEFRDELAELSGKVEMLSQKLEKNNKVKIGGEVELKYRDRMGVSDNTKVSSPLNGFDVDGDKGKTRFNDSVRNLLTDYDRTPFRLKTTLDINSTWHKNVRFFGTFSIDDGAIFKLGNLNGQAVGGHFGDEGLSSNSFYLQRAVVSFRDNFEGEFFSNMEKESYETKQLSNAGTSFYHDNKQGVGLAIGFMNFQNILRTGTKFKNHFNSEKWIGHGYGLVGFGADEMAVKETPDSKDEKIKLSNSVSRFWASGINVSNVDPDSARYNNTPSASFALDATMGPLTLVFGGNYGSPYVNRFTALNSNLGAGAFPQNSISGGSPLSLTSSPTGILTGVDFLDGGSAFINEKVTVGTKDPLSPKTAYNLLSLPSEYGDGYMVAGLDLDLGLARVGLNMSDYWLDSFFSITGTRKNFSAVVDVGSDSMGMTFQANYHGIGLDTYSAGLFMNNLGGLVDVGFGVKTATRGLWRVERGLLGTNAGFYVTLPQKEAMPKFMLAFRQSFGEGFGTTKDLNGQDLGKVTLLKDGGVTLSAELQKFMGTSVDVAAEYNLLNEGAFLGGNFMAHDFALITKYKF